MKWRDAVVTVEGTGRYVALIATTDDGRVMTHNGAVIPRFSVEVARTVVSEVNARNAVHPDMARLEWAGDAVMYVWPDGSRDVCARPDGDGMYGIGAREWCWSELGRSHHCEYPDLACDIPGDVLVTSGEWVGKVICYGHAPWIHGDVVIL